MEKLVVLVHDGVSDPGANPGISTILDEFVQKVAASQKCLPAEFAEVLEKEFWNLL